MFPAVPQHVRFPDLEQEILQFWQAADVYHRSLRQRQNGPPFVFYEGPPTANGKPHPGHCLTRAIKDLFPRYRTMRGYYCQRKAGWDTHGLPVEVEVCKELGIHSKEEIEAYGVEPFIHKCQQSVWRYMRQWEAMTRRLGFWVDLNDAYVTYHQAYVESVWWCLKNLFDRGLLYQGHKIVWWWAQGGTALSSGEVGQGYRQVADPSVYVRFPLLDAAGRSSDTDLLVWTTTPWTLPSNQFVAVHPDLEYATVRDPESTRRLIVAAPLVAPISDKVKRKLTVVSSCRGQQLVGRRYGPPMDDYFARLGQQTGQLKEGGREYLAWRVVPAEFVTTDSGTGVVHQAPAFGEVDFEVLQREAARFVPGDGPELICAVAPDGTFTHEAPDYEGQWVKATDKQICRNLRQRGLLYHQEQYLHEYPFCWRAENDPLIQYPRRSWFVRTTRFKDRMLENNGRIHWLPEHIRDGRFGNFLESNVDWALSRERYWGTPLPIWVCERTGRMEAVASYAELMSRAGVAGQEVWAEAQRQNPAAPEDLRVHKPYIDAITYDSPFAAGARMRRVPEVIDCWFDSGAMPFAQWGYPHQGTEDFWAQFPADFISEALDQTRGWFYSLLAISTLLFGDEDGASPADTPSPRDFPHPYRNCIVLGLMLGEDGGKMSKSKRNYREPQEIFDRYGADALRWYFFANQAPWTSIRYSERAIKESIPEFLLRLWNVFSFFVIYANIDRFDPLERLSAAWTGEDGIQLTAADMKRARGCRPVADRSELDRWVLSELNQTCATVVSYLDNYDNFNACASLHEFVDGLSNWYVRRSRDRFWSSDREDPDKLDAYWTLYECLLTTSKLIAPFVPFLAEYIWRHLTGIFGDRCPDSVHLCDFPVGDSQVVDATLSRQMQLAREVSSLGRSARMGSKLKVRQPLSKVEVVLADDLDRDWLQAHAALIAEELNVKQVEVTPDAHQYIRYQVQPNFKLLGPMLGRDLPEVKQLLTSADGGRLMKELQTEGRVELQLADGRTIQLTPEQVQVRLQARDGWAAAQGRRCVVVLSTELTEELIREGWARDLVRFIQERRKELDCQYTDRIHVTVVTRSEDLSRAVRENTDYIRTETLADVLTTAAHEPAEIAGQGLDASVGGHPIQLFVSVAR